MKQEKLILASGSKTRADMLESAGVEVEIVPPRVDESSAKVALLSEGHSAADLADALAELKAIKVSSRTPGRLVLGADQVLEQDGKLFDKPQSVEQAKEHLSSFSAKRHKLISAAVIAENGRAVFRARQVTTLHVRPLSDAFLNDFLARTSESVLDCVGAYALEGLGAQLFHKIEGDYFTVLGLPLLDVLGYLRERGYLTA